MAIASSNPLLKKFAGLLLQWHQQLDRPLPWKGSTNPYLIWLSEILLQQTRVEQGLPYYLNFVDLFPTVFDLAHASEDEVLKAWEGLGYYNRARNLHFTAKYIAFECEGVFPHSYDGWLALKGVGPYTAAAIVSFAFNLPYAVVDGNVFRVLSRIFGIDTPINSTSGKKAFHHLANQVLDKTNPAAYNQAIMDFGAVHCKPKKPLCSTCPFQGHCRAFQEGTVDILPVKLKKVKRKNRYLHFVVLEVMEQVVLEKRTGKDVWRGLHAFPCLEGIDLDPTLQQLSDFVVDSFGVPTDDLTFEKVSLPFKQLLTHQKIMAKFWLFKAPAVTLVEDRSQFMVDRKNLRKFAFPKIIDCYLTDNSLNLILV